MPSRSIVLVTVTLASAATGGDTRRDAESDDVIIRAVGGIGRSDSGNAGNDDIMCAVNDRSRSGGGTSKDDVLVVGTRGTGIGDDFVGGGRDRQL